MFEAIRERICDSKRVVFVTGAGISQESGIPTFRGKDGLWRNHDVMKLATIDTFYENPKLVWEWYNQRRENIFKAEPNAGHKAIAELEKYVEVAITNTEYRWVTSKSRQYQCVGITREYCKDQMFSL